jgi:hypothetical protein
MAHSQHIICGHKVIASDWHNFVVKVQKNEHIITKEYLERIQTHSCAPLISIPLMFSYYLKSIRFKFQLASKEVEEEMAIYEVYYILNKLSDK